jgi:hypothetical protein
VSTPDILLVTWWLLTVAPFAFFCQIANFRYPIRLVWSYSGVDPGRLQLAHSIPLSARVAVVLCAALTVFGGFVLILWMHHWTRLLLLNFQIVMMLLGLSAAAVGLLSKELLSKDLFSASAWFLSRKMAHQMVDSRLGRGLIRSCIVALGLLLAVVWLAFIIGDLAFPRATVEGRVDHVERIVNYGPFDWGDDYLIVIDGKQHNTLRDVFFGVRPSERVRAEIGAGSKTVMRVEPAQ